MSNIATGASTSKRKIKKEDLGTDAAKRMEVNETHTNITATNHRND